jgi:hypothetical protein
VSDFSNVAEIGVTFSSTELDTGVDFVGSQDIGTIFTKVELDEGSDFTLTGDLGTTTIVQSGFGEGGFDEGPFGGGITVVINNSTPWTEIDTP